MQPHEWGIIGGLVSVLFAVAGFLATRVIKHGEQLAALDAQAAGTEKRFDRQDQTLADIDRKLDALMQRWGVHSTPPRGTERA